MIIMSCIVLTFKVLFDCVLHRQKRKEKRQKRSLERKTQGEEGGEFVAGRKRLRKEVKPSSPLRLEIDCSFDNLMMLKVARLSGPPWSVGHNVVECSDINILCRTNINLRHVE